MKFYKIPEDIILELKNKYPNVEIQKFCNDLLALILEKVFKCGSCSLGGFGRFLCFKTFSDRLNKDVIRLKFKLSVSLYNKIKNDEYLLESLTSVNPNKFDDDNIEKCNNTRKINLTTVSSKLKFQEIIDTNNKLAKDEIIKILES